MSFEKLQVWLKNKDKFNPPLDLDDAVEEIYKNLTQFKDLANEDVETHKDLLITLLGKTQMKLLEFCNQIDVDMDQILKDKFKLLDSGR
ncbi:MAG TPA: hypothetical protein VKK79_07930 [Candidatus Lokiarchaeia archaeon]|nr:hypothetical protein [Candidatus Lokiarchaeia archaeon]